MNLKNTSLKMSYRDGVIGPFSASGYTKTLGAKNVLFVFLPLKADWAVKSVMCTHRLFNGRGTTGQQEAENPAVEFIIVYPQDTL